MAQLKEGSVIKKSSGDEIIATLNDINTTTSKAYLAQSAAPTNVDLLWIDTGNGGILKYYNGSIWVSIPGVWG